MLDLLDKEFTSAILNMFKILKVTMSKELKENMRTLSHQIQKTNKELQSI